MKNIKKSLCTLIVLAMIFSIFSACSNVFKEEETTQSTTVSTTRYTTTEMQTTTENTKTTFKEVYTQAVYSGLKKDPSGSYPHKIAEYSTYFNTGDTSRSSNIKNAAGKINNIAVPNGAVFSFNQTVGKRTVTAGYDEAHVIRDGELVDGLGGGVCQVSSTIFEAVLRANIKIVERSNHSLKVGYVPLGGDATVSFGSQDFKFKNNTGSDIRLSMIVNSGKITCQVWAKKKVSVGNVKINITGSGMDFVLTRTVNGKKNYSAKSHYEEEKKTSTTTKKAN